MECVVELAGTMSEPRVPGRDGADEPGRDGTGAAGCSLPETSCGLDASCAEGVTVASDSVLKVLWCILLPASWLGATSRSLGLSSASSAIFINFRRRREPEDEEVMESVAVWRRQVDDNELSLSPDGLEKEKTASWGENLSRTDWN